MTDFFDQITRAVNDNLYYLTLFAALAIPDICGALESQDGQASGAKYKKWFDDNLHDKYGDHFTGEECYWFRCALLHQARSQHPNSKYKRILFVEPSATTANLIFHRNIIGDAYNIDVRVFCLDVVGAGLTWLRRVRGTDPFQKNEAQLIKRHPEGLAPYVRGVPVITS